MGGLVAEDPTIPAPIFSSSLSSQPTERERLSRRRRRTARWLGGALALLLAFSWWMLRADARTLGDALGADVAGWLTAAAEAPRALLARVAGNAPAPRVQGIADARRAGARLAHGPTASRAPTFPAEPTPSQAQIAPRELARSERGAAAPSRPATPAPAAAPAAPSAPPAAEAAPPPVAVVGSPGVGDVLADLVPTDFQGSLDAGVSVGELTAGTDLQVDAGAAAVDTTVRVDAPAASADLGTSLAAGPAASAAAVQVAPGGLAANTSLATPLGGAGTEVQAGGGQLGTNVALEVAGTPAAVAAAAEADGLAIDVSTGALEVEVNTGQLPLDLPLDLRLH